MGPRGYRLRPMIGAASATVSRVIVGAADRVADAAVAAGRRTLRARPAAGAVRRRQLAIRSRKPLPSLFEHHPDARTLVPRQLGLRTIPVAEIVGTAVSGAAQRGGDFLPLAPFRSGNWKSRWQRIRKAVDRLAVLPPIDVLEYAGGYWVVDGHNRVAAALYEGQIAIDASVTELVTPGAARSEAPVSLAADLVDSLQLRAAGEGHRQAFDILRDDS